MNYPWMIMPIVPFIPTNCSKPPTIYALLNSYCNFDNDDKIKIKNLAEEGRGCIFDFNYPLSSHISKKDFEVMILNHFIMRRIGFDTPNAFKIALNVKLNEIMPRYNKLFDLLDGWDLFADGEVITRNLSDNKQRNDVSNASNLKSTTQDTTTSATGQSSDTNTLSSSKIGNNSASGSNTSDRRFSDTPQNNLSDIRDGTYVTNYNYDSNTNSDSSQYSDSLMETKTDNLATNNSGTEHMTNSASDSLNSTLNSTENNSQVETIRRTPADKIRIYNEFIENSNNIYSMIFKDLDPLFYGLI